MKMPILLPLGYILCCIPNASLAATRYVDITTTNSVSPFTNRTEAAASIQDAVDVAVAGDIILVADGVYSGGGTTVNGLSNRVVVTKAVIVRSENGPAATSIVGVPLGTNAVRCVLLDNGAMLDGFTLTNGGTLASGSVSTTTGGGVYCSSGAESLTNCVIVNCTADYAGGLYRGIARSCIVDGNKGGGAAFATLHNCVIQNNDATTGSAAGGAEACTLYDCQVRGNSAKFSGGGIRGSMAIRCVIANNDTEYDGGGAMNSTLHDCLVTGNLAFWYGGGVRDCALVNCTVVGNRTDSGLFYGCFGSTTVINSIVWPDDSDYSTCKWTNSCTPAVVAGPGNMTNNPQFSVNYRLSATSPCLNQGGNTFVQATIDLDGVPRIVAGTVDMGVYEWQVPTHLAFVTLPGPSGAELTMSGETGRVYNLLASSDLVSWFWLANVTNTVGQVNYTDPLSPYPPARFYRAVPLP